MIPWYIWLSVVAVTSAMVGVHWDISWHRSIGRDTFFTPAHVAIYLCGVLAGITCGYLILSTTFGHSPLKETSVNIWGFRGPLGAFISAWGGFVMLASAPFDDWWHSAYGLDVKILSPPHIVLAVGMIAVEIGALILIQSYRNRASTSARLRLEDLFLYVAAMIMVALLVISLELTNKVSMHRGAFYRVVCLLVPVVLAAVSKASGRRWAATVTASVYTLFLLGFLWILPLFPAQPKLGPVYHEVKFFIPAGFPLLIVFPALALDLIWARTSKWSGWMVSLVSGFVFLAVLFAVQWPFADFLMSPAARNAFFGSAYLDYYSSPNSYQARYAFLPSVKRETCQPVCCCPLMCTNHELCTKTQGPVSLGLRYAQYLCIMRTMKYGYARVSTDGQSVAAQVATLTQPEPRRCSGRRSAAWSLTGSSFSGRSMPSMKATCFW